jgi:hypothetical protein
MATSLTLNRSCKGARDGKGDYDLLHTPLLCTTVAASVEFTIPHLMSLVNWIIHASFPHTFE